MPAVDHETFQALARTAFGDQRRLASVERVRGGSKKGVYRLAFDDGFSAVVYSWDPAENFWPGAGAPDPADPFSDATGADLFEAAHAVLSDLAVRTPEVYLLDRSHQYVSGDVAIVEDLGGGSLETALRENRPTGQKALADLATDLVRMQAHRSERPGKVAHLNGGGPGPDRPCEALVFDRALRDLRDAGQRDPRVAPHVERIEAQLHDLVAAVEPRTVYGLIHGELGPDHVLLDRHRRPVLIDIEGLMWFDVEWEHAFLRMRFSAGDYARFEQTALDGHRLKLYKLALHLSLVAGPLRLLDGDFPDRAFMLSIVDQHVRETLSLARHYL